MWYLRVLCGAAAALGAASVAAAQPAPPIHDVSARFPLGPYATITTAPTDPAVVAVGTETGTVGWSRDGGRSVETTDVLIFRKMDPVTLRGTSGYGALAMRPDPPEEQSAAKNVRGRVDPAEGGEDDEVRSMHQFLELLNMGLPGGRYALWMSVTDPQTMIHAIAIAAGSSALAVAAPSGIWLSDRSGGGWLKRFGAPGVMPRERDPMGLAVGIDPRDPRHILAATDGGIMVSHDGGNLFMPHPDGALDGAWVTRITWDPANPDLVFMVAPDQIYLSQDGGRSFEPSFSAEGEIRDLALSPDAAIVATSEGLYLAYADRVDHVLKGKDLVGAIAWTGGRILAASADQLFLVEPGGATQVLRTTTPKDPFLRMAGGEPVGWLLSRDNVYRIGDEPRTRGTAPRLLLTAVQVERAVLAYNNLGGPGNTRLHNRWYAKLLPDVEVAFHGRVGGDDWRLIDATFPIGERYLRASAHDRLEWSVWASWDLSDIVFGDSNAVNPNLIIETNLREKRKMLLDNVQRTYREVAELAEGMARPPADPEAALLDKFRLAELASYLEFLAGRPIIGDLDLE